MHTKQRRKFVKFSIIFSYFSKKGLFFKTLFFFRFILFSLIITISSLYSVHLGQYIINKIGRGAFTQLMTVGCWGNFIKFPSEVTPRTHRSNTMFATKCFREYQLNVLIRIY